MAQALLQKTKQRLAPAPSIFLKILAIIWFTPIYAGAMICLGQLILFLDRKAGLWILGESFENTVLYTSAVYYLLLLTYLAFTKRVWVPNNFLRYSVRYLFALPKWLKKLPAYGLSFFPAFVYVFIVMMDIISTLRAYVGPTITDENVGLQTAIVTLISISLSWAFSAYITHRLLNRVHFLKVHALHDLKKQ